MSVKIGNNYYCDGENGLCLISIPSNLDKCFWCEGYHKEFINNKWMWVLNK